MLKGGSVYVWNSISNSTINHNEKYYFNKVLLLRSRMLRGKWRKGCIGLGGYVYSGEMMLWKHFKAKLFS